VSRTANNDWDHIKAIFDDALRQPQKNRETFIRQACAENEPLLKEIRSLLVSFDSADAFMETPAVVQIVENILGLEQQLKNGQLLGHYEIDKLIGSGGMGEVYLARDTRLNRNVAIKLLRASFLPDAQAKKRLLREARAAALLEHPNICQIYEIAETDEHCFIVMQYVVGTTLADLLPQKALTVGRSLDIVTQIVEGLSEAHAQGIIHRDIKPANVIVSDKGPVKILDFGLAKFIEAETNIETSQRLNTSGAVMGTVPFMSPEQLLGEVADERTDIFSFGVLLYEMLSGRPAFTKNSNAETISAILNEEPDWSLVSAGLQPIIKKCLAKRKAARYDSCRSLAADLAQARNELTDDSLLPPVTQRGRENVQTNSTTPKKRQFYFWQSGEDELSSHAIKTEPISGFSKKRSFGLLPLAGVTAAVLLLGLTALFIIWQQNKTTAPPEPGGLRPVRLVSWKSASADNTKDYRISHNGKMIAYSSSRHGGVDNIYIKQISESEELQVTKDSWPKLSPLWSPDDQRLAFVSIREGQNGIYASPTLGGVISPLLITDTANIVLRHWARDGSSIFYEKSGNLYRLDLTSREIQKVTPFAEDETRITQYHFDLTPDEERVVFCAIRDEQTDIWIMSLVSGDLTRVTNDKDVETRPVWCPNGQEILYNVWRNDFIEIDRTRVDGEGAPAPVTRGEGNYELIDVSDDGTRIYYMTQERRSDISGVDLATKKESEVAAESELELWPDVSPDGTSIVYQVSSSLSKEFDSRLFIKGLDGKKRQLPGRGSSARWLPDSRHIAVVRFSEQKEGYYLWIIDTVTGNEKLLTDEPVMPSSYSTMPIAREDLGIADFSADGEQVVYLDRQKTRNAKIGSLRTDHFILVTRNENANVRFYSPRFSPDGKRIAILSIETFPDKSVKPISRLLLLESGSQKEVFSTTSRVRLIGWSPAGDQVALATIYGPMISSPLNAEVLAISLTGRSSKITSLTDVYMRTLALSADRTTMAFTARRGDHDDIWTAPAFKPGQPTKITDNSNSRLFLANLIFARDGRSIYFDKQEEINTISMFENFN